MPRRRTLALVVCLIACAGPVHAQGVAAAAGGVEVGAAWSKFSDLESSVGAIDHRPGFLIGIYGVSRATENAGLQTELLFVRRGSVARSASSSLTATETLDYLQIPLLLRIGPAVARRPTLFAVVGPAFSYLLRAREVVSPGGSEEDIKSQVTGSDFSVVLGGGFRAGRLEIEGRYDHGFRNLVVSADRRPGDPEPKNRTVAVIARVRL